MSIDESKQKEFRGIDESINEVERLQRLLEQERERAKNKEKLMSASLQESKRMASYLKHITQALTKERQAVVEKSDRERLLWKLIERINSSFDLEQILQATVDELGYYFKVNRCGIIIPNFRQNKKDLVREYADGQWKRPKEVYSQVSLSILYRTVTKTLKPLVINDTLTHDLTSGHLSDDLRSILMVPLLQNDNELVGVVYLHQCKKQRSWTESELTLLQSAGNPIATAVEKSKLFGRAKSWASREKLLNRLTSRIRGTLNIKVILERTVAELGQALLTSRCFINIIDDRTSREIVAHEYSATNIEPLGTGKENPLIINKLSDKDLDYIAITDVYKEPRLVKLNSQEIEKLHSSGARSFLSVPITFQNKLFGWLCFQQCGVPRDWSSEEISFVQSAASQVGVAINQAEIFQEVSEYKSRTSRELKQAAQLQSILLRSGADTKKNLKIAVSYHPHHNVSGDFYWVNELAPHKVGILIGDVSGKGPAAALLTGYIIGELKGLIENQEKSWYPEEFISELSDSIYEQNQHSDFYATAWYGIYDLLENKLVCCNAGHPSPYLMRDGDIVKLDDNPGVPLGLLSENEGVDKYMAKEFNLKSNDRMVVFTDGLTEQRQLDGKFVPESWLSEALVTHSNFDLNDLPEHIIGKLNAASNAAPADDDRLLVAIEMPELKTVTFADNNQDIIQEKVQLIIDEAIASGLPEMFVASLKLGLIEAIYNSLRHGFSNVPEGVEKIVTLAWWLEDGAFSCTLKDPGAGFDWKTAQKTKREMDDVDILSEGGRGLPLLFEIFSDVKWNPAGNEVGLTLRW